MSNEEEGEMDLLRVTLELEGSSHTYLLRLRRRSSVVLPNT